MVCFKLIADQAAAKSDGQPGKKIAAATTQRTAEDTEEETGIKDIIANILSVSAIKNEGYTLGYENDSDSFYLSHPCGQAIFTRRDNGLYVSNFGPSNVFVSTVSDLESQYAKREVQEAQAARDLQRRLAAPPDKKLIKALSDGTIQGTTVTAEHVR